MIVLDHSVDQRETEDLRRQAGGEAILDLTVDPPAIQLRSQGFVLDERVPSRKQRAAVRSFDLLASGLGIILLSPVFVLTSLLVGLTSRGAVVYRSKRIGQGASEFAAFKFRSMSHDAEAQLEAMLAEDPAARKEYERYHKLRRDPRVTKVGRFIRRTSLDELPQLFNILRGDMSLVGPRPNLLDEVDRFGPAIDTVLRVKPGLTGLWQVNGRSNLDFDERIMLDIDYALNRTLGGDVLICLRTVGQMVATDDNGAY